MIYNFDAKIRFLDVYMSNHRWFYTGINSSSKFSGKINDYNFLAKVGKNGVESIIGFSA